MRKLFFLLIIQFIVLQTSIFGQFFFTVELMEDNITYKVKLRPDQSFPAPSNFTSSMQVGFTVPTGGFKPSNVTNINGTWTISSTHAAPSENSGFDYVAFELSGGKDNIIYVANEETELFSFENIGECTGTLDFITEDDPFFPPNSENANIGNLITVFGAGFGNAFSGTYGPVANCLMSQAGNTSCEELDSIITTNPTECGLVGGTISIYATSDNGFALKYSIDDGATFQPSNVFTDLASSTTYSIVVSDQLAICYKEHGIIELGPPSDAVLIGTSSTADSCMKSNGTISIDAVPVIPGATLEYSIDEGTNWLANGGFFTDLAAGTYNPRVRLQDAPCHQETEEVVVPIACSDDGGGEGGNGTGMENTNCIYTVVLDAAAGKFTISILPDTTINDPENLTSTALFSIKVPTGSFTVSNLQSLTDGANFELSGIEVAPSEAPAFDYISFGLSSRGPKLPIIKGQKIPLISFENGAECSGGQVFLVENFTDPFFDNGRVSTGQQLTVFATGTDQTIICTQSNEISDCGQELGGTTITNFPTDTIYATLPIDQTTTLCLVDELNIVMGDLGTVSLCNNEGTIITTLTDGSNCIDLATDDHFNQSETICIVHFDTNDPNISDTTILILCPGVDLGADLNICAGETMTLSPLGGTGNFMWITDGNISCTDCSNPEITPDAPTQYIVMSTENDRCMDSDTLMVNITDAPNIGMVNFTSPTGCEANGQINITADGGQGPLRYSIDNGTTFQDEADFDNLGAGTYNIVVANQDEVCTSSYSESISMIIAGAPTVDSLTVIPPNECKNVQGSITASGSSADPADVIEYSIDEGNTWQTSGTFSDLAEGSYNLAIRIQGSNCSTTFDNNPIEISQVADLRITTPPGDKIICGESDKTVQLELSETITDHNITGGLYTNDIVNDNVLTFIVDPVADGSLYSVTITGQSGCSITEEFTLTPGEDAATWSDNVVINNTPASCAGNDGSLDVIVNGNNNGFTFCWEPNKASGPMREGLSPDSTYTLTVTSSVGCTAVFDNIQTGSTCEVPSCNIFTGLDTLNAFVVDGQATACIPIADMDLSEFQFYVDGARQQMQFGECMQTSVSYAYQDIFETGQAPFTLTKWTVNNDTLSNFEFNTVEDLVVQLNQFDFQANWVLNESLKTIQGFSTANIYGTLNIQSNDANQVMEISLSTLNTMYQSIILGAARGIKKYTLKDPLNDCEDDLFIKVQGLDDGMDTLDLVTIVNTPITNQCLNTEETGTENLEIKVCDDPSVGILNSIDDGDACFGYMPATDFVGKDFFCLELCNGDICDTTIVRVTVNEEGLLFFTGFSPNNDGINDVFSIKNIESYPENNVTIYNRWGNRMFQKENYTNKEGWDGTFTGKMAPDGIYFYLVKVKINEEEEVFSGPVTLSR